MVGSSLQPTFAVLEKVQVGAESQKATSTVGLSRKLTTQGSAIRWLICGAGALIESKICLESLSLLILLNFNYSNKLRQTENYNIL